MAPHPPDPRSAQRRTALLIAVLLAVGLVLASCSGEEATPIDPANPPVLDLPDVSHPLQPTQEMRALARTQCLEDPMLVEGYVQAVDPDTGDQLAEITVDCAEVRSELGSG